VPLTARARTQQRCWGLVGVRTCTSGGPRLTAGGQPRSRRVVATFPVRRSPNLGEDGASVRLEWWSCQGWRVCRNDTRRKALCAVPTGSAICQPPAIGSGPGLGPTFEGGLARILNSLEACLCVIRSSLGRRSISRRAPPPLAASARFSGRPRLPASARATPCRELPAACCVPPTPPSPPRRARAEDRSSSSH